MRNISEEEKNINSLTKKVLRNVLITSDFYLRAIF